MKAGLLLSSLDNIVVDYSRTIAQLGDADALVAAEYMDEMPSDDAELAWVHSAAAVTNMSAKTITQYFVDNKGTARRIQMRSVMPDMAFDPFGYSTLDRLDISEFGDFYLQEDSTFSKKTSFGSEPHRWRTTFSFQPFAGNTHFGSKKYYVPKNSNFPVLPDGTSVYSHGRSGVHRGLDIHVPKQNYHGKSILYAPCDLVYLGGTTQSGYGYRTLFWAPEYSAVFAMAHLLPDKNPYTLNREVNFEPLINFEEWKNIPKGTKISVQSNSGGDYGHHVHLDVFLANNELMKYAYKRRDVRTLFSTIFLPKSAIEMSGVPKKDWGLLTSFVHPWTLFNPKNMRGRNEDSLRNKYLLAEYDFAFYMLLTQPNRTRHYADKDSAWLASRKKELLNKYPDLKEEHFSLNKVVWGAPVESDRAKDYLTASNDTFLDLQQEVRTSLKYVDMDLASAKGIDDFKTRLGVPVSIILNSKDVTDFSRRWRENLHNG